MSEQKIFTIQETVKRSKQLGMPITEYTLRRALHTGAIPCRVVGRKYLIAWPNVENWLMCTNGADNTPVSSSNGIRQINI